MKTPKYLQAIAHVFADPILENTGLEGGRLINALNLMQEFIEKLFYKSFPDERLKLEDLYKKIERCKYYLTLIENDRRANTQTALQTISQDILSLAPHDWLLLPGGWQCRTKPGHAMLYLVLPNHQFVVITTGSGGEYHQKHPLPHAVLIHFLTVKLQHIQYLVASCVLEALLELLIKPSDYYSASFLYEVIFPMLGGQQLNTLAPLSAFEGQLAGTCFWQVVDKLLFFLYRDNNNLFLCMQYLFEKYLLEQVFHELQIYINGVEKLTDADLQSAPWATYFQLLKFAIRHFCIKQNQINLSPQRISEQHRLFFLLQQLDQFASQQLERPQALHLPTTSLTQQPWHIDGFTTLFDHQPNSQQPDVYHVLPIKSYQRENFVEVVERTVSYGNTVKWDDQATLINMHFILEQLFHYLPLPSSSVWAIFLATPFNAQEIEKIANSFHQLLELYFKAQSILYPSPSPDQYARQLIAGFSVFCFIDGLVKNLPETSFVAGYVPALHHLSSGLTLAEVAPSLILTSPQLSNQLMFILNYLQSLLHSRTIFNFTHDVYLKKWSFDLNEQEEAADVALLNACLHTFQKQESFYNKYKHLPLAHRHAYGIIDSDGLFFPQLIHCWRNIGIYCRMVLSRYEMNDNFLQQKLWELTPVAAKQNAKIWLTFNGFKNVKVVHWAKYQTSQVKDAALAWLCDTASNDINENSVLTHSMPESSIVKRRTFNELAEIKASVNLQIIALLEWATQHVHYLQLSEMRLLLEKYLFEAGPHIATNGSLLQQECQQTSLIKQQLLHFMNTVEYYFCGQLNRIQTYLALVRLFLIIEKFLMQNASQLICKSIFEKLYAFILSQDKRHGEIAAHLILLYQNAWLMPFSAEEDIQILNHVVVAWAHLLRSKLMNQALSADNFHSAKCVLLSLQDKFLQLMQDASICSQLADTFLTILLNHVQPKRQWQQLSAGCLAADDYYINLFDGKIYYKKFLLSSVPEEIVSHPDYRLLFGNKMISIELERASSGVRKYRTLGQSSCLFTVYQRTQTDIAPTITEGVYTFCTTQYGQSAYRELNGCNNIHAGYFSPNFAVALKSPQMRIATLSNKRDHHTDTIIHQQLMWGEQSYWGQFIPRWRLEGLLPTALLDGYRYWLVCAQAPTTDFMAVDFSTRAILASAAEKQTLFVLDQSQRCCYVCYILPGNKVSLLKLNDHGVVAAEWVDILRLPANSLLAPFCKVLCQFELPTFMLVWREECDTYTFNLVRHQLNFRLRATSSTACSEVVLESLNFNDYCLTIAPPCHLPNIGYQLTLTNKHSEKIILFPCFMDIQQRFLSDDHLSHQVYSNLLTLGAKPYFSYRYSTDLLELEADSLLSELYLLLLYAKSRQHVAVYQHLEQCWTDQILMPEEWSMLLRFFAETQQDPHPDILACRVRALLLYLPIFTLLFERASAKDVLTDIESSQLSEYQAMFKTGIKDYECYLKKWRYVHHKMRLDSAQEKQLITAIQMFKLDAPQTVLNRHIVLKSADSVVLKTPAYTQRPSVAGTFLHFTLNESELLNAYLSLTRTTVDFFGYNKEAPQSFVKCFLHLYVGYKECSISAARLQVLLHAIVWSNQLTTSNKLEFNILQLLRVVAVTAPQSLPSLPFEFNAGQLVSFSCVNESFNSDDLSKKLALWFKQLLAQLRGTHNRVQVPPMLDLTTNLLSHEVPVNVTQIIPNTCPSNSGVLPKTNKVSIQFDVAKFKSDYGFDPQQPLGHLFAKYFNHIQERPPTRRFPLISTGDASSPYNKTFSENELARHLLDYFRNDFDYFQTLLNDRFVMKGEGHTLNNLKNDLFHFLTALKELHSSLKVRLLSLANKNPCKQDEAITATDDNKILGLQIKYLQLSHQCDTLSLTEVWQLLLLQQKEAYLARNPFLTNENVMALFVQTIEYLLLGNAISMIIRLLNLIHNYQFLADRAEKENLIAQIGKGCFLQRFYLPATMPLYLILEYLVGSLLWQMQIESLDKLKSPVLQQLAQIFLGGGKSSTIAPLLGCLLADGKRLMIYTIPSSLIAQFIQVLRYRLRGPLAKRVHTFSMQRITLLTPDIVTAYHNKLLQIAYAKNVLVITPDTPSCLLLKWVELSKMLHQGSRTHRDVVIELDNILCVLGSAGVQLIDEIDTVIAPQKSELNFTEGAPSVLSPAPMRWQLVQKLFLILMTHPEIFPILHRGVQQHDCKAHGKHTVFKFGMLELINIEFYQQTLKPALANIIINEYSGHHDLIREHQSIFLSYLLSDPTSSTANGILLKKEIIVAAKRVRTLASESQTQLQQLELLLNSNATSVTIETVSYYLIANSKLYHTNIHPLLAGILGAMVLNLVRDAEPIALQLVLCKEFINKVLPHVLQSRLAIHYGPYFEFVLDADGNIIKQYFPERKLPVPYSGKDRPSKRAEFQDPDIIVGYACLQYFYLGLREDEFKALIATLQCDMEAEISTALHDRNAVRLFRQWQTEANIIPTELNQLDLNEPWQILNLYRALYQQISVICYYLDRLVFPCYLKVYPQKLTSNGFDLAAMIFNVTKGITATVHNGLCLPDSLTQHLQRGADGAMLYTLDLPANQEVLLIDYDNDEELLAHIDSARFRMFIDTEGLIQQLSNIEVARFILNRAPSTIQGVIYIDDHTEQQRVIVRGNIIQRIHECSIPPRQLFKYINHGHIRGTDVPQSLGDRGYFTVSPTSILETGFQGAKRLRMLDIYASQSVVIMMRKSDAKLVRQLLNLDASTKLVSRHILQWKFSHTIAQISNELQVQIYQRLHAVIRCRAYFLLLGKYSYDRLPASLDEDIKIQCWEDLHDKNLLDDYDRATHEIKPNDMQAFDYLPSEASREIQRSLANLYRYRQKQPDLDTVTLCLQAFSESVSYLLQQALPIDTSEHTADHLKKYLRTLQEHFGGILLNSDRLQLESIVSHAQQFLPRWTTTKHLGRLVERERQSSMQLLSQMRQQQSEQQSEKVRQQQQEKQSQQFTLFRPAAQVPWQYQQLLREGTAITSFVVSPVSLNLKPDQLRLLRLCEILPLPFVNQLMVSENFLRTEMQITDFRQFAKNIFYYMEVQERDSRQFIILDVKEAGYIRYCLDQRLLDNKAIGLRLLSGTLLAKSSAYTILPVPELLQVQLYFLNGFSDNEIPSSFHATWQRWKDGSNLAAFTECQQRVQLALSK